MIDRELAARLERIKIITKRKITSAFAGDYKSAFKGRGMEFEEVRPYQAGDDIKFIDWNVTARSAEPYVKIYREERELSMMILLDLSASGLYSSTKKSKNELAAELCAILAFTALSSQDQVGLCVFTDHIETVIPPGKGSRHVMHLIKEVLTYKPTAKGTCIQSALEYTTSLKKKSVVFLISDFHDLDYEKSLAVCAARHDLVCIQFLDKREEQALPYGLFRFRDPESNRIRYFDGRNSKSQKEWNTIYNENQQSLKKGIHHSGADLLNLHAGEDWIPQLARFFMARRDRY